MATTPLQPGAAPAKLPSCASNVLPFQRPEKPLVFAPGVIPFDRSNPAHVRAWNTLFALGWSERRAQERIDREGC